MRPNDGYSAPEPPKESGVPTIAVEHLFDWAAIDGSAAHRGEADWDRRRDQHVVGQAKLGPYDRLCGAVQQGEGGAES